MEPSTGSNPIKISATKSSQPADEISCSPAAPLDWKPDSATHLIKSSATAELPPLPEVVEVTEFADLEYEGMVLRCPKVEPEDIEGVCTMTAGGLILPAAFSLNTPWLAVFYWLTQHIQHQKALRRVTDTIFVSVDGDIVEGEDKILVPYAKNGWGPLLQLGHEGIVCTEELSKMEHTLLLFAISLTMTQPNPQIIPFEWDNGAKFRVPLTNLFAPVALVAREEDGMVRVVATDFSHIPVKAVMLPPFENEDESPRQHV